MGPTGRPVVICKGINRWERKTDTIVYIIPHIHWVSNQIIVTTPLVFRPDPCQLVQHSKKTKSNLVPTSNELRSAPLVPIQEPLHHIPEHTLRACIDNIPVTRNQPIKVPGIDPLHRLAKRIPVRRRGEMPDEAFLPRHGRLGRQQRDHDLGHDA